MNETQVEKDHYDFKHYLDNHRWMSYYYQIISALDENVATILYIGAGDGIVVDVLKKCGKKVKTFDFASDLNPDIIGSVTEIEDVLSEKYDCIMCCQVLEHLPFEEFENIIKQFKNITNKKIILSLPLNRRELFVGNFWIPKIHQVNIKWLIHRRNKHGFRFEVEGGNEHYWELGTSIECSRKSVRNILSKYFDIENEFNPIENTYHVFYVLKQK